MHPHESIPSIELLNPFVLIALRKCISDTKRRQNYKVGLKYPEDVGKLFGPFIEIPFSGANPGTV